MLKEYTEALIAYLDARREYETAGDGSHDGHRIRLEARRVMDEAQDALMAICARMDVRLSVVDGA